MASYDFVGPRLLVEQDLGPGAHVPLDRAQSHYLLTVLRRSDDAPLLVFNGRDGEWRARLHATGRKSASLEILAQTRPQPPAPGLHYLFAPLKTARLDYVVQKAVEMGAGHIQPVLTRFTQAERLKPERMAANAREAAEQCGILSLPTIGEPCALAQAVSALAPDRLLVFCDEDAPIADPVAALRAAPGSAMAPAVLVGPEGGFSPEERAAITARPNTVALSLGPRILRADTAAVAVLALVQAVLGDGRG